jgi:hypothetical protein
VEIAQQQAAVQQSRTAFHQGSLTAEAFTQALLGPQRLWSEAADKLPQTQLAPLGLAIAEGFLEAGKIPEAGGLLGSTRRLPHAPAHLESIAAAHLLTAQAALRFPYAQELCRQSLMACQALLDRTSAEKIPLRDPS